MSENNENQNFEFNLVDDAVVQDLDPIIEYLEENTDEDDWNDCAGAVVSAFEVWNENHPNEQFDIDNDEHFSEVADEAFSYITGS